MYVERRGMYADLEEARTSKVLLYVTGDRRGLATSISSEVYDFFVHHLDLIDVTDKITLILYTTGGDTLAAWSLANLIRLYCDELEVVVPQKARSAGTLMCLAADSIVMTKQATLGPIDPSVNTALNPEIPNAPPGSRVPVSVEGVGGYIDFARSVLGEDRSQEVVFQRLVDSIHPLVLGSAFRARTQIRMLARKLMLTHQKDNVAIERSLDFLCSESGSHDYTINRREAKSDLSLPILKPSPDEYALIKRIYDDFAAELELNIPYDPRIVVGTEPNVDYSFPRALIESVHGGSHAFYSEGSILKTTLAHPTGIQQEALTDTRRFESWRHQVVTS